MEGQVVDIKLAKIATQNHHEIQPDELEHEGAAPFPKT
jgi:hypothetical protein